MTMNGMFDLYIIVHVIDAFISVNCGGRRAAGPSNLSSPRLGVLVFLLFLFSFRPDFGLGVADGDAGRWSDSL